MTLKVQIQDGSALEVSTKDNNLFIDNVETPFQIIQNNQGESIIHVHNKAYRIHVIERKDNQLTLSIDGQLIKLQVKDHVHQMLEQLGMDTVVEDKVDALHAPMPGTIKEVNVKTGQTIQKGDTLLILEAMKMENVIKSPIDGVITDVKVKDLDVVEKNQLLISF